MTKYFEIKYDHAIYPDRWHLDCIVDEHGNCVDANLLPKRGPYVGPRLEKVKINIEFPGKKLDFSFGSFDFLMVSSRVADLIESYGGKIQRYPVTLEPLHETGYEVIFTLDAPKGLVDFSRVSEYEFFESDDSRVEMHYGGIRPRQKGMLRKIYDLYLQQENIHELEFFRLWEYPSIIISESLKNAFELIGVTGIKYRSVT